MTTRVTSDKWNRGWVAVADVQRLSTWSRHWNVVSKELDVLLTSLCSVLIEIVTSSRRLSHACWLGLREATCPSDGSVARSRCCAASQDIVPPRSSRHEEVAPARSRDCRQTARLLPDVFVQHSLPRPVPCSSVQTAHLKSFCCSYYCRGWCARVQFCYLRVTTLGERMRQGDCALDPDPDPYDFRNLVATSLSKDTSLVKFSRRSVKFLQIYEPNCGKCPISLC